MIKNIDHINIVVDNLEEAKAFFTRFGFWELDAAELSGQWISLIVGLENVEARYVALSLPGGATHIELIEYRAPASGRDPRIGMANQMGYRHLAFEVDDIQAEVERLARAGIACISAVQTYANTGKKLVYFHGPDGILLELAEYPRRAG